MEISIYSSCLPLFITNMQPWKALCSYISINQISSRFRHRCLLVNLAYTDMKLGSTGLHYCQNFVCTVKHTSKRSFWCIKQVSGESRAPRSNPQRLSWDWYENDVWWSVIGRRMAHDWHKNYAWLALDWHGTGVRWVWDWGETVEATLWIYCVLLKNIIRQRLFLIWCHHRGRGSNNKAFPYLIKQNWTGRIENTDTGESNMGERSQSERKRPPKCAKLYLNMSWFNLTGFWWHLTNVLMISVFKDHISSIKLCWFDVFLSWATTAARPPKRGSS